MGYDRGDSFPFDFEPNGSFHFVQNLKENCHHDHIPFNLKGNGIPTSFLSLNSCFNMMLTSDTVEEIV